jgi:tetratricopeptide (TPR) repeat protein
MNTLTTYSKQDRYEDVLGLPFRPLSRDIDNQKIRLLSRYSTDTQSKMAINKSAAMLKKELQDKDLFVARIRYISYILYKNKCYADAIKYAEEAVQHGGTENDYMTKAMILLHTDGKDESLRCLERYARLHPNSKTAKMAHVLSTVRNALRVRW